MTSSRAQVFKNYRQFRKYTSFWEMDFEFSNDPFPHMLIKLHGRLESYMNLREHFVNRANEIVKEGIILIFDFGEVPYASSVFLKYFLDWCQSRHEKNESIGVIRISAFIKGALLHLNFQDYVRELPFERFEWQKALRKENTQHFLARFRKFLASVFG